MSELNDKDRETNTMNTEAGAAAAAPPEAPEQAGERCGAERLPEDMQQMAEEMRAAIEAGDFDIQAYLTQYREALSNREEMEAKLLRLQADFDNYRRRARQDNETAIHNANCATASALLPVLDNLERAVQGMKDGPDKDGVVLIARQFLAALQSVGLEEILAEGAAFDPNLHQAVLQTEAGPEQQGKITMVLQKGYLLNGKLLRAAMVQVGV